MSKGLPISEAVRAGDFIFLSGLVGLGPDGQIVSGGVAAETDRIMLEAKDTLQRVGCQLSNIIKVTVYLEKVADIDAFNAAYGQYFPRFKPARTDIFARSAVGGRVAIDLVAYLVEESRRKVRADSLDVDPGA